MDCIVVSKMIGMKKKEISDTSQMFNVNYGDANVIYWDGIFKEAFKEQILKTQKFSFGHANLDLS